MAGPLLFDRVKETTTTTGTGTYTLAGAATGFRTFAAVGDGNTCYYCVENGTDWEVGLGTYTASGTTLARTAVLASSNSNNAVSWGAGTKNVFLTAPATALERHLVHIRDEKAQGTDGGTFTSGAWRTRTLNTEVTDTGNHASLSSNQITLAAGTWDISCRAPCYGGGPHQARLWNTAGGGSLLLLGDTAYARGSAGTEQVTPALVTGRLVLASSTTMELQHRCGTTQATFGFGVAGNFTTEIYSVFEARKVG